MRRKMVYKFLAGLLCVTCLAGSSAPFGTIKNVWATETVATAPFDIDEKEYTFDFVDDTKALYEVSVDGLTVSEGDVVRVALWSEVDGQDDIRWYVLSKQEDVYRVNIRMANFSSTGLYHAHLYHFKNDGSAELLKAVDFNVDKIVGPKLTVDSVDRTKGTAVLVLSGLEEASAVKIPVWSTADQSDIYWYTAFKKNGTWTVNVNLEKHKNNWGTYQAHAYAVNASGAMEMVDAKTLDFSLKGGQMKVEFADGKVGANVSFPDLSAPKLSEVRVAVWSAQGGQDDLKWHILKPESKFSKLLDLSHIKSAGVCHLHAYAAKTSGELIMLDAKSFTIEAPTLDAVNVTNDEKTGSYTVTFKKPTAPNGIAKLQVEVFSKSDKSDAKLYDAKEQSDGSYKVSGNIADHNYNFGTYQVQVVVTDGLGLRTVVQNATMMFEASIGEIVLDSDGKETLYNVRLDVNKFPMGLGTVHFAVWSEANNQDDIKWYTATKKGNTYSCTIDIRNHKTMGKYYIHAYGTNHSGRLTMLKDSTELNVAGKPSGTVKITGRDDSKGRYDIVLSGAKAASGVELVQFAVWTADNGQKDIYWYTAVKQADGTYKATVDLKNHKYNVGAFIIHCYVTMGNQIRMMTDDEKYTFDPVDYLYLTKEAHGKRTIIIRNPSSVSTLRFAVWSDAKGQDDIVWYTAAKAADGLYKATVDSINHEDSGLFHVHVYSGSKMLGLTTFDFPKDEFAKHGWYYETHNGRTYKLYYEKGVLVKDVEHIIGKQSEYRAEVNRTTCTVTIYAKDGANGFIIPVKAFACSVGLPETPTPTGTFYTKEKYRWHELMGPSYGQYCTRIVGGILFHSVAGSHISSYNLSASAFNKLGQPASHGCVRLCVRDAKWIYDNCKLGMQVRIYDSSYPGPLGKPATIKIPSWQNWDPTDPAVNK